ncbi:MAG: hypothetical protein MJ002_02635 [Paludibacteraceae bacterium]|nr:hypothetical protein [Paludibacteraceae bacterium]
MEYNKYCFVMQPFDNGCKFDKRYNDIYEPAIRNAGLNAYRIDKDLSVRNIVDDIEEKITKSQICLADITIDNPNVWYELGFAFAKGKDVVMVCDNTRVKYPFDIQHRSVINYQSDAPSDFTDLSKEITNKIKAYLSSQKTSEELIKMPLKDTDEYKSFEMTLIALLVGKQIVDDQYIYIDTIRIGMEDCGYNETATSIALRLLERKSIIESSSESDRNGNSFPVCRLTKKGFDFVLDNIDKFNLNADTEIQKTKMTNLQNDGLPF